MRRKLLMVRRMFAEMGHGRGGGEWWRRGSRSRGHGSVHNDLLGALSVGDGDAVRSLRNMTQRAQERKAAARGYDDSDSDEEELLQDKLASEDQSTLFAGRFAGATPALATAAPQQGTAAMCMAFLRRHSEALHAAERLVRLLPSIDALSAVRGGATSDDAVLQHCVAGGPLTLARGIQRAVDELQYVTEHSQDMQAMLVERAQHDTVQVPPRLGHAFANVVEQMEHAPVVAEEACERVACLGRWALDTAKEDDGKEGQVVMRSLLQSLVRFIFVLFYFILGVG